MTTTLEPASGNAASALQPAPTFGIRGAVTKRVLGRILRKVPVTVQLVSGESYGAPPAPVRRRWRSSGRGRSSRASATAR